MAVWLHNFSLLYNLKFSILVGCQKPEVGSMIGGGGSIVPSLLFTPCSLRSIPENEVPGVTSFNFLANESER